jgi:hypothetical protein
MEALPDFGVSGFIDVTSSLPVLVFPLLLGFSDAPGAVALA